MGLVKRLIVGVLVATLVMAAVPGFGAQLAAAQEFSYGQEVFVNTDFLNLRDGSSLDSAVIDVLPYGTTGTIATPAVAADGYNWYYINLGSQQGWVAGGFLGAVGGNDGGYPVGTTLEVASGPLNLRSSYGVGTTIVGSLLQGVQVEIVDGPVFSTGYTWYAVYVESGSLGWVAGEVLGPIGSNGESPSAPVNGGFSIGNTLAVDVDALNFRTAPSTSAEIVNVLPFGAGFEVVGEVTAADGYNWVQIRNDGYGTGWAATNFLVPR